MRTKSYHLKRESITWCLLSRQVHLLAFEASRIEPVPLTFKASVMSTAPVVLHYTSGGSRMWIRSRMRVNPLYLSKHSMSTRDKIPIVFYIYLLYNCVIIGSKGSEMRLHKNGQCDLYVVFSPKSVGNFKILPRTRTATWFIQRFVPSKIDWLCCDWDQSAIHPRAQSA